MKRKSKRWTHLACNVPCWNNCNSLLYRSNKAPCTSATTRRLRSSELIAGFSPVLEASLEEYFKRNCVRFCFWEAQPPELGIWHCNSEEYLHGARCKLHCTASWYKWQWCRKEFHFQIYNKKELTDETREHKKTEKGLQLLSHWQVRCARCPVLQITRANETTLAVRRAALLEQHKGKHQQQSSLISENKLPQKFQIQHH